MPEMNSGLTRSHLVLLAVGLVLLGGLNVAGIDRPPFDAHSFRQAQTLATIELYARDGIDLLHSRTNYVGEPGIFVLELPIFQAICAAAYRVFGEHIAIVRSFNILLTLGSAVALFLLTRRRFSVEAAFAAVVLFLFSPLNLLYMSSTLIDPGAACVGLWSLYFCDLLLNPSPTPAGSFVGRWCWFSFLCVLTALLKALYLFPVCVMMVFVLLRERAFGRDLLKVTVSMGFAGAAFFAWNYYATQVNDTSPFTSGVRPTSLLGSSQLLELTFYRRAARRILIDLLGPVGGLLAVGAWVAAMLPRTRINLDARIFLLFCGLSVGGYWVAFANITIPHDYYSLIALPLIALPAGVASAWLGGKLASSLAAPRWSSLMVRPPATLGGLAAVAVFLGRGGTAASPGYLEMARLSAGRFTPWEYAMIFVTPDRSPGGPPIHDSPAMLYAAGVRGTGQAVSGPAEALQQWRRFRPHYRNLRYVIFFGLPAPKEIVEAGRLMIHDEQKRFSAFELY